MGDFPTNFKYPLAAKLLIESEKVMVRLYHCAKFCGDRSSRPLSNPPTTPGERRKVFLHLAKHSDQGGSFLPNGAPARRMGRTLKFRFLEVVCPDQLNMSATFRRRLPSGIRALGWRSEL